MWTRRKKRRKIKLIHLLGCLQKQIFENLFFQPKKIFYQLLTASFIEEAIIIGFFAFAIAVLINTPSQPSSMAIAASEAVPIPASTITGTLITNYYRKI